MVQCSTTVSLATASLGPPAADTRPTALRCFPLDTHKLPACSCMHLIAVYRLLRPHVQPFEHAHACHVVWQEQSRAKHYRASQHLNPQADSLEEASQEGLPPVSSRRFLVHTFLSQKHTSCSTAIACEIHSQSYPPCLMCSAPAPYSLHTHERWERRERQVYSRKTSVVVKSVAPSPNRSCIMGRHLGRDDSVDTVRASSVVPLHVHVLSLSVIRCVGLKTQGGLG